ncbi:MAG TPA: hypothetical protein VFA04_18265 [Bryobacteraceae bacterium]|nr:hypothetical protein [Bryobacteraceae bacterium]
MPAKPRWLLQIPAIIDTLAAMSAPVVDRAVCERLFGLRRRRAIDLMRRFGGYQAGSAFLIDRVGLIDALHRIERDPATAEERHRKERLSVKLEEARRLHPAAQVRIAVQPNMHERLVRDLPDGVCLRAGHLAIDFVGVEQLLSKLYELSQAAAYDYDAFCSAADRTAAEPIRPAGSMDRRHGEADAGEAA